MENTERENTEMMENCVQTQQPHDSLFLVLPYLPLLSLLAMSEVCRPLRDAVAGDVLLWLSIVVQSPLDTRLSDDILAKLTSRANGRLTTLALIHCGKITDDGLQQVMDKNPHITELIIPRCHGLTPNGVIKAVKTLNKHNHALRSLKINGINYIDKEHLKELQSILETNWRQQGLQPKQKRILYHEFRIRATTCSLLEETNCPIDLEICPKCNEVRMVFDCPKEDCKCRGCYYCIRRCVECGKCVNEMEELGEAVCMDPLCLDCWHKLPKCSFCNKPYCKLHVGHQDSSLQSSSGFICNVCYQKFVFDLHDQIWD